MECPKDDNHILPNSVRYRKHQWQPDENLWKEFKEYMIKENQSASTIKNKVCYAKRFHHMLESKNTQGLSKLSPDVKVHAMKALASLSKFLGRYDDWLDIIKRHQLKWSSAANNSMKVFKSIFDCDGQGKSIDFMMKWIRGVLVVLPQQYKNVILSIR